MIQLQQFFRDLAAIVLSFDSHIQQREALKPAIIPWMKKPDQAWWSACEAARVSAFVGIADGARPNQIFGLRTVSTTLS
jgi:hypothetical protein